MPELLPWTAAESEKALLLAASKHLRSKVSHRIYGKHQFRVAVPFHGAAVLHPKIIRQILKNYLRGGRRTVRRIITIARSKVTSHGQISIPPEAPRKLGIGPGSILEWTQDQDRIVVSRVGRFSFTDIHQPLFSRRKVKPRSIEEMKAGIHTYVTSRHASG